MKPYQRKSKYKSKRSKWEIATELARSSGAVEARIYIMGLHKQPKRYESVSDTLTTQDVGDHVSSDTNTSILKRWWNQPMGKES